MTTRAVMPRDQMEMVCRFKSYPEFAEAYLVNYKDTQPIIQLVTRSKNLWGKRNLYTAKFKEEEEKANRMVMIPAKIVNKCKPRTDTSPDVGELLVNTNHLLAELVQLQKEQIALFTAIADKKS
jgi:hypothetical protein